MQIAPLTRIETLLLHETTEGLSISELKACVKAVLSAAGLEPVEESTNSEATSGKLAFRAGNWRLTLRTNPFPVDSEKLKFVLALPYTRTIFPEAKRVVQAHAAHTLLSLEKIGQSASNKTAAFTDTREALPGMSLVALLARELMSRMPASALYWAPSDHLLPPPLFETLTSDTRLILLNIRPQYITGEAPAGGNVPMGMIAWGTQHLFGRLLLIDPVPLSPGDLHGLAAGLTVTILENNRLPSPGEHLAAAGTDWQATVRTSVASDQHLGVETLRLLPVVETKMSTTTAAPASQARKTVAEDETRTRLAKQPLEDSSIDPDLSSLPPDVRDDILEHRRRRQLSGGATDIGSMKTTFMNIAAGSVLFIILANVFMGRAFMDDASPRTPQASKTTATVEIPLHPPRKTPIKNNISPASVRMPDDGNSASEERVVDEEREYLARDNSTDEEQELRKEPDEIPDLERGRQAAQLDDEREDPTRDDAKERDDLIGD